MKDQTAPNTGLVMESSDSRIACISASIKSIQNPLDVTKI